VFRVKPLSRKLEQVHIDYLLNNDILKLWVGETMKDRVALFSLKFPGKLISISGLYRFYRKYGVKRKKVQMWKIYNPGQI
jgi:hypothetical protein